MTPLALLVDLVALVLYGSAIVLLHEIGHAVLARPAGLRVTSFGIGVGPPLLRFLGPRGVVIHLDALPIGGSCVAVPLAPDPPRRWLFHVGGLIAQGLLAVVLLALPTSPLLERIALFNGLVALTNAFPWRVGAVASDGWYLLDAWMARPRTGELVARRAGLRALARRQEAIGSPIGATYAAIVLAWADLQIGRPAAAEALIAHDPPQTAAEPWFDILYTVVTAEWSRAVGRPEDAVRAVVDVRTARGPAHATAAADLLAIAEARALLDLDRPEHALEVLSTVLGAVGPAGRQAAVLLPLALVHASASDLAAAAGRAVHASRRALLDPLDASAALHRTARRLRASGDLATADQVDQASAALVRRVLAALDDDDAHAARARVDALRAGPRPEPRDRAARDRPSV